MHILHRKHGFDAEILQLVTDWELPVAQGVMGLKSGDESKWMKKKSEKGLAINRVLNIIQFIAATLRRTNTRN